MDTPTDMNDCPPSSAHFRSRPWMSMVLGFLCIGMGLVGCADSQESSEGHDVPPGATALFNGEDLSGWVVPEGDGGHWRVVDGVIDYDALSEAEGDKTLWTEQSFEDVRLYVEWRLTGAAGIDTIPLIEPDGAYLRDDEGDIVTVQRPNADSGIYLRGEPKVQVNIWNWPIGSGEVYGYRTDESMPDAVRAGVTPRINADRALGEWNTFVITLEGERLTVELNGTTVLDEARLPGAPEEGPIGLQHHGGVQDGQLLPTSSLVQFRNIYVEEL